MYLVSATPPLTMAPDGEHMTAEQKLYWLNALQVVGDWSVHDDGEGRLFYYDRKTDASQWQVPESLASHETEFMMKLMLQNAVARSGAWSAHDAGNGTLYYFNSKTRESAWQRPSEWGQVEAEEREREQEAEAAAKKESPEVERQKKEKKKHTKHKKKEKRDEVEQQQEKEEVKQKEPAIEEQVEEEQALTADELEAEKERKAREQKRIEQFRAMLRDKNIMPLCKWSVALPQIAGDPRFMGVPTMDERRAIFEHFVEHRRDDLKSEKKNKLKQTKQLFTQLLREQFQLDSWAPNTSLSAFLSTLEGSLEPDRYKQIQDDTLALLTVSTQERIYAKAVAEYKSEALKRDGEELRLTKFLEKKLGEQNKLEPRWDSDDIQGLIHEFYSSAASESGDASPALLLAQKQKQVFEEIVERMARSRTTTQEETNMKQPDRSRSKRDSPMRGRGDSKEYVRRDPSSPRQSRHSHHERHRRSDSRSYSRGRERSHRSRRRSASYSRSRSRSRGERSSRRFPQHRRHHSSSRSRSRSRPLR